MNLFRKKTHIFASFGEKELSETSREIQDKLESLLPVPEGQELRLSISENVDLSMEALCAISFFSNSERNSGTRVLLKAKKEVVENLKTLGLECYFDDLMIGE